MEEVIELLGIVEGINYDGVINEFEIQKLQDWLKRNQSLKYHNEFSNVINKLDEILEDNYISEDEKNFLMSFAKENLDKYKSINDSLNVLNGIIEGVVCDNIINEQEVNCLHFWLKNNTHLENIKVYENIYKIVKDILKDNIVTKEEQKELLELLSNSIIDSKFDLKIDYLKKLVLNRENIGMNLIESIDDEILIEKIHENAQGQLSRILNSYSGSASIDNELVFISLVLIGLKTYNGSFYSNVENTYRYLYDRFSNQKIEGQIRSIINKFKSDKNFEQTRIINAVLMNAIVPQYFLPDFFEFIFDIYRLNFDFTLDENIYSDFKFIYEGISEILNPNDDELHFNTTKKTYKLIQSTKQLILSESDFESIIHLSINVIKLIDKIYWEEKEISIINSYLKEGYHAWIKEYYNNRIQKHELGQSRNTHRSRWKPLFELEGKYIYIKPPKHKIKSTYSYSSIKIVVENDGRIIYENASPYIQEIFGGYQINSQRILIDEPLSQLTYKIYAGNDIIYDSHKELFREVIVFDTEGEEIANHTNYCGDAIFCFDLTDDVDPYYKSDKYNLGIKAVNMSTVLMFGQMAFNFSSIIKPGIAGDIYIDTFISNNQVEMPVYKRIEYLVFESEYPISSLGFSINQNKIKLDDYSCDIIQHGNHFKYVVKLPNLGMGIYDIYIFRLDSNEVLKNSKSIIAVDPLLSYKVTKLNDENYNIDINSSFIKDEMSKQLYIREFSKFKLDFFYKNTRFNFKIPFKIPMYQLDDLEWHPLSDMIWIDDIRHDSQIRLFGIDCVENEIRVVNENSLLDTIQLINEGNYFKSSIGFIKKYKANYEYVNLIWLDSLKQMNGLCCLNVSKLNEDRTNIEYDPMLGILKIDIGFMGKGNVCINIFDNDETVCFKQDRLNDNQSITIHNIKSFSKYKIVFFEKSVGFSLNKERVLKQFNMEFYSYHGLVGCNFRIGNVIFDQYIKKQFIRKTHILRNTFIRIDKIDNNLHFIGNLYVKNKEGNNFYLYKINPVEIEITGDLNNRYCEIAITKDLDGLLLDFAKHTICNTLDDPKATDIFSYTIDLKERE